MSTGDPLPSLMARYQAGDEEAFTEIYRMTSAAIARYLSRWAGGARVADLVQETYLQLHRARRTYRSDLPFRPWLYAIARHVAQQALRADLRRAGEVQFDAAVDAIAGPDDRIEAREIELVINTLPPEQREAVWLADVEGLTSVEIARLTGETEGCVRVRLHRARQKLKRRLRPAAAGLENVKRA